MLRRPPLPPRLGQPLPIELVLKVIVNLKHKKQYPTLAGLPQADSTYYKLVMPNYYETITINGRKMVGRDYEYSNRPLDHAATLAPMSGVSGNSKTPDTSVLGVLSAETTEVRSHPLEEYRLRLVIDIPLDNISTSLDRVFGPMFSRYTNIREIVYTSQALTDRKLIIRPGPPSRGVRILN